MLDICLEQGALYMYMLEQIRIHQQKQNRVQAKKQPPF